MGTIIESSNQYRVLESVTDSQNGNTYQKVRHKGIGSVGYIKSLPGVDGGETISKSWYDEIQRRNEEEEPPPPTRKSKTLMVFKGHYDGSINSDSFDMRIEVSGFLTEPPTESEAMDALDGLINAALSGLDGTPAVTTDEKYVEGTRSDPRWARVTHTSPSVRSFSGYPSMDEGVFIRFQYGAWAYPIRRGEIDFTDGERL